MSGVKCESDRVSRLGLDSGYCFVRRRGARQWRQGAAPACFIQSAGAGRDLRRPPNLLTPPLSLLPSLPLITNMTDFTLSRLFPLWPQVATIEMSDTSD